MTNQKLAVGEPLKNGATLLAWKEERDNVVVLALTSGNEFVTWKLAEDGGPFSGNYYRDLLSSVEDFKTRS